MGSSLLCFVGAFLIVSLSFLVLSIRVVPEHKQMRVYRLGRDIGEKGPGLVLLLPFVDRGVIIDLDSKVSTERKSFLAGAEGESQTSIHSSGIVLIGNQAWDATSDYPIAPQSKVRVKRVVLEVEVISSK